jgi:competence protein ComEA
MLLGLVLTALGASQPAQAQEAAQSVSAQASAVTAAGIDINSAPAAELAEALQGVGLRKAEAIVRYREQFGPFESVEELAEVKGIGAATLERNRALIRLN